MAVRSLDARNIGINSGEYRSGEGNSEGKTMHARWISVAVLCLLCCLAVQNAAQERSDEATIRSLESKWTDAYKQRQVPALAALLADDYVTTMDDRTGLRTICLLNNN